MRVSLQRSRRRRDHGFTLVELIIAIVLSAMIGGVVVMALVTSLNVASSATAQVGDSTDAGLISSFLVRDAQSAGGIDPATALVDPLLGVSNDPLDPVGVACTPAPSDVKLRLSWIDRSVTTQNTVVVTYAEVIVNNPDGTTKIQLVRSACTDDGTSTSKVDVLLGLNILSASATCTPDPSPDNCSGQPETITLTVTGKGTRAPLVSIMTASLRSASSQLTVVGPPSLPAGQLGSPYPTIVMTTIGAALPATWVATGLPAGIVMDPSGIISGTPTGPAGTYTVTITATDSSGAKATKVYTIVVHAPPVANADGYSVNEDSILTIGAPGVLSNDTNSAGTKSAILYSGVANGSLTLNADGSFVYTPRPGFFGTDSFQYKVTDGSLGSNIATVTISVTSINDGPVVMVPIAQETQVNVSKVFASASNRISISDVDAAVAVVQVQLNAANGNLTLPSATGLTSSTGSGTPSMTIRGTIANINASLFNVTFTPNPNFVGAGQLQVVANDLGSTGTGGALTDTKSIAINVTPLGIFTGAQDVGLVKQVGSSTYASPTYTVKGSGWDIWEASDGFQFIYRPMTGDGSLTARILAPMSVLYNGAVSNPSCFKAPSGTQPCIAVSKGGVMFRSNLTSGSAIHAMTGLTQGNGSEFIYRQSAGAGTSAASPGDSLDVPYWVRLSRRGNQVTAETSPDGATWTQRGTPQTIAIGSTMYAGLAVSAVYQLDSRYEPAEEAEHGNVRQRYDRDPAGGCCRLLCGERRHDPHDHCPHGSACERLGRRGRPSERHPCLGHAWPDTEPRRLVHLRAGGQLHRNGVVHVHGQRLDSQLATGHGDDHCQLGQRDAELHQGCRPEPRLQPRHADHRRLGNGDQPGRDRDRPVGRLHRDEHEQCAVQRTTRRRGRWHVDLCLRPGREWPGNGQREHPRQRRHGERFDRHQCGPNVHHRRG